MESPLDPALDRMTEIVRCLSAIMRHGRMPAVDLADERAVLSEGGIAFTGLGEASGPGRAERAIKAALVDLAQGSKPIR